MADSSKDGLLLGRGIPHVTATSQFMHRSKQVPACVPNIVFNMVIFSHILSSCAKEYLSAATY